MIALYIALGVIVLFLLVTLAVYLFTFYSPHKKQNDPFNFPPDDQYNKWHDQLTEGVKLAMAIPYETVTIRANDGTRLVAKYYHKADGAPIELCVHGYRGVPVRDFNGGIRDAMQEGYNVLAIENRGADRSGGHTITFGIRERYDVVCWINYLNNRFNNPKILLAGVSMGASTVLMVGCMKLPPNVIGIFADSPYSSPKRVVKNTIKTLKLPKWCYGLAWCSAAIWGGFDLNDGDILQEIDRCPLPTLIIHGDEDRICNVQMSRDIVRANPNIQYLEMPHTGHVLGYFEDHETYQNTIQAFRAKVLQNKY